MPRNSQGVYSLPSGNPVVPGTLIESTWANPTMSDIGAELTGSLPRNGSAGMTGPLILARDGQLPKEAVTFEQVTNALTGTNSFMPAGAIQAFAFNTIPTGWLECNGAAVSRTTYANLFSTIGITYGAGNGVTTFNLPDLRGEFIRGWDNGRSVDPNRVFGSNQAAANNPHTHSQAAHTHTIAPHNHTLTDPGHTHTQNLGTPVGGYENNSGSGTQPVGASTTQSRTTGITIAAASTPAENAQPAIASEGTEARPRNVAMVYCIKAFGALQTDGLGSMAFQNKEAVNITGGTGVFTTLQVTTAPAAPDDVVRLSDIAGGTLTSVSSSDTQVLLVDNTDPQQPILRPQTNVPFGMVKLDANGKVPNALMDPTGYNYQGTWDASSGLLPSSTGQLDGSMYYIDIAGTLNLFHSDGVSHPTVCSIGTRIVYVTESPTLPVPNWYYEPPPTLSGATAAQVTFVPTGNISSTNVQDAIVEVNTDVVAIDGQVTTLTADVILLQAADADNVKKTSSVGAAYIPAGDTADRPAVPGEGMFRFNEELGVFEGYTTAGGWGQIGGGQMYGNAPTKAVFYNSQTIGENLTVKAGENGGTFGPVTVNDGFTVTVENGSVWSIV